MRVLVEIGHPAHVHTFRFVVQSLQRQGHQVCICAWNKDVTLRLLDAFGLDYHVIGINAGCGLQTRLRSSAGALIKTWNVARAFGPDVFLSRVSPVCGLVSRLVRKPHISFGDTDFRHISNTVGIRLTDLLLTPECFRGYHGSKHVRVNSYKELAYLHPRYFTPDPSQLSAEGFTPETPFSVVRFVSWQAAHDRGQGGFSREGRLRLVRELSRYGRVLVLSEGRIDPELADYEFRAPPHLVHHYLYYALVCVTEGGTMATECAVLGTPAVWLNTLRAGVQTELEERYGLVSSFHDRRDEDKAITTAVRIAQGACVPRQEWRARSARLINEHIDLTEFIVQQVLACGPDTQ